VGYEVEESNSGGLLCHGPGRSINLLVTWIGFELPILFVFPDTRKKPEVTLDFSVLIPPKPK
jgi:hypothetical protein